MPEVSFVTTVFNGETYLLRAIESMVTQTVQDIEICIVLDGSTDRSEEIAREAAESDPRINVISMPRIGRSGALNVGVAETAAPVVAILDCDDLASPRRAEATLKIFTNASDDVALVGGAVMPIQDDQTVEVWPTSPRPGVHDVTPLLRRGNPLGHSSVAIRREHLAAVGGYSPRRLRQVDYELYVRLGASGLRLVKTDEVLAAVREHPARNYLGPKRLGYRMGSLRIQQQALASLPGPPSDSAYLALRALGAGVPQRYRSRWNVANN